MKSKTRPQKIAITIIAIMLILILALVITVIAVWHNEIRSVMSIQKLSEADHSHRDGAVYEMTVYGDYGLDDYVAQGGTKGDEELKAFVSKLITKGLFKIDTGTAEVTGCSSFTASAENGDRLYARNYDLRETSTCIVHTNPGGGRHSSVSTVDLKFLGVEPSGIDSIVQKLKCSVTPYIPVDGMNDAGVACAVHMSHQPGATAQNTGKPGTSPTVLIRLILDHADSVEEAVELAQQYDMYDSGGHSYQMIVADSTGKSAILNWTNGTDAADEDTEGRKLHVTYNENGASQYMTNFVVIDDYYEEGAELEGLDRYEIIEKALEENGSVFADKAAAMGVLQSAGKRLLLGPESVKITVHSIVYDLSDRTAIWVGNEHYDEADRVISLSLEG